MSRFRNVFTTTAILVGSSAALLTGGIAKADPAPAPIPPVPGLSMIQDLVDPAKFPQLLQAASSVLSGAPAAAPVAPVAPAPIASASVNLPQQPAALPGTAALPGAAALPAATVPGAATLPPATVPGPATLPATAALPGLATLPATAALPGIAPAAAPAVTAPVTNELIPSGLLNLPTVPGLPVPLPQHLTFPGDLASLMPGSPGAAVTQPGVAPAPSATSPMPGVGALFPTSALP